MYGNYQYRYPLKVKTILTQLLINIFLTITNYLIVTFYILKINILYKNKFKKIFYILFS